MQTSSSVLAHDSGRMSAAHWGTVLGGSALALLGLSRKSHWGLALAAGGGVLAYAAAKSVQARPQTPAQCTLTINTSPEEAYRFWKDFESMPQYMNHVESVQKTGENRYRWTAAGPMGKNISWEAAIDTDVPNEKITWRSLPGSDVQVNGSVVFRKAPDERGTLVTAKVQYFPNGASGGSAIANFLGKSASFLLRQDMRKIKAMIETGEIPTTEGQPHGRRGRMTGIMRALDVTQPPRRGVSSARHVEAKRRAS